VQSQGIQYDSKYFLGTYNVNDQENYYKSSIWMYNNNMSFDKIELVNDKDKVAFIEKITTSIKEYATESSGKLLFRVNVFNRNGNIPKRYRKRKLPLKINRGFKDVDEFVISLPEGYKVDGDLFAERKIENKFGMYQISVEQLEGNKLKYNRTLLVKEGSYPKEDYKKYRDFRKKVSRNDNIRIAITNQ